MIKITQNYKGLKSYLEDGDKSNMDLVYLDAIRYAGYGISQRNEVDAEAILKDIEDGNIENMAVIPWDKAAVDQLRKGTGCVIIKPFQKLIIKFNSCWDACAYVNELAGIGIGKFDNPRYADSAGASLSQSGTANEAIAYQGWMWMRAFDCSTDEILRRARYMTRPIKNITHNKNFETMEEAVAWVLSTGKASSSEKVVARSIARNLNGETQKSYSMRWEYA